MKKVIYVISGLLSICTAVNAGGLLTNTNQNIAFNRNFARDGAIGIDGVYANPAGVAFLSKGWHLSFNAQNVYQSRTIKSGMTIPSMEKTPFYQPFKLNGGNENGIKEYTGNAAVPILPSLQAALNYDKWGIQMAFGLFGGGGKATFNDGLGSFERQVSVIPALLASAGLSSKTPHYSMDSYLSGQQYIFGVQLGSTYKMNKHLSAYAGMRINYVLNKYEGNITNITANIGGANVNLNNYFAEQANKLRLQATMLSSKATNLPVGAEKTKLEATAAKLNAGASAMDSYKEKVQDKYLDCTQTGWGVTPIIGLNFNYKKWNVGTRMEFNTYLNIQNNTKRDDTGMFKHGVNTPNDIPALWTIGVQYAVLPNLRTMVSYHHFFDKSARMANNKQEQLSGNTQEYLAGAEWDITKDVMISAGMQRTKYGLGDGSYLSDMSFVTSSYSFGFGGSVRIMKRARLNVAYFWTNYEQFDKSSSEPLPLLQSTNKKIVANNTDNFTRTNKVLGVGLDIDF